MGLSIYLFLPVRSSRFPLAGTGITPVNLKIHKSGLEGGLWKPFAILGEKMPRNVQSAAAQVRKYSSSMMEGLGWFNFVAGLPGLAVWLRGNGKWPWRSSVFHIERRRVPYPGQHAPGFNVQRHTSAFYIMSMVPLLIACGMFLEKIREMLRYSGALFILIPLTVACAHPGHRSFSRA